MSSDNVKTQFKMVFKVKLEMTRLIKTTAPRGVKVKSKYDEILSLNIK